MKAKIVALLLFVSGFLSLTAAPDASGTKNFFHAINLNPVGIAFGSYGGNYELLLAQTHGLVFEGAYANINYSSGSNESRSKGWGLSFNYRWHWSNAMESGFLGVFARYSSAVGTGTVTATSGSVSTKSNFDVDMKTTTFGLNIGKRWVWDSGINVVVRIGYGYAILSMTANTNDPNVNNFLSDIKPILQALAGFDAELSIGYAF